jgi:hypothetical protein
MTAAGFGFEVGPEDPQVEPRGPRWSVLNVVVLRVLPFAASVGLLYAVLRLWWHPAWWYQALVGIVGVFVVLLLLGGGRRTRLLTAIDVTGLFAAAVLAPGPWWERLSFAAAGVLVMILVRQFEAVVWPDVAVLFVVGLAANAVVHQLREKAPPPPPPPALAAFDLPGDRVQLASGQLKSPSRIVVVAVTRGRDRAGVEVQRTKRHEALLLTPLDQGRSDRPVRVVVARGDADTAATALAGEIAGTARFVLFPTAPCFVAPEEPGLSHPQTEALLEGYGFDDRRAASFARSFSGLVDFVVLPPGKKLNRYFSGDSRIGHFLTDSTFATPTAARRALALRPKNRADRVQMVTVSKPTMALTGGIAEGSARQFIVLRSECFTFGPGSAVGTAR